MIRRRDRHGQRSGLADHEGGLSQGQRQRHAAGPRPADHVCGAAAHPGDRQSRSRRRFDQYFTQQLLPEYIEETGVAWNVVYDARGHFHEPHTEHEVPLGTLQVRDTSTGRSYGPPELSFKLSDERFPTFGPHHRYGAVLFIEKEGFMPLFEAVQLAERYDLAIMSTKGMSVTASRRLVEELCGRHGIPLLLLHDFDKSGFSIAGTLQRDTRRYTFQRTSRFTTSACAWRISKDSRPRR